MSELTVNTGIHVGPAWQLHIPAWFAAITG